MGRPRKVARRTRAVNGLCDDLAAFLFDEPLPEGGNIYSEFDYFPEKLWPIWREYVLATWIKEKPGTRPAAWWLFDAPRMSAPGKLAGTFALREMCEPRKLLKGIGRPAWERYAISPRLHLGIPETWTEGDPARLEFETQ